VAENFMTVNCCHWNQVTGSRVLFLSLSRPGFHLLMLVSRRPFLPPRVWWWIMKGGGQRVFVVRVSSLLMMLVGWQECLKSMLVIPQKFYFGNMTWHELTAEKRSCVWGPRSILPRPGCTTGGIWKCGLSKVVVFFRI